VTFSKEVLMYWLGKDFANNSAISLQWLAAGVFINCLAQVIYTLIQGQGRPDLTAKIHLLEIAFYLPLLFWILNKYGITGAAIAWTLRVTVDAVLLMWVAQRMNHFKSKILLKMLGYSIVPSMALALCGSPDSFAVRSFLFVCTGLCLLVFSVSFLRRNGLLGFYHQEAS
jgi:O-antigen/teichoic acid export membrane protein